MKANRSDEATKRRSDVGCAKLALTLLMLLVWCAVAAASEQMLDTELFELSSYGLSVRPPIGAAQQRWPNSTVHARFLGGDGYTIDLFVRSRLDPQENVGDLGPIGVQAYPKKDRFNITLNAGGELLTVARVETITQKVIAAADPNAVMFDRSGLEPDGRAATAMYFKLSPTKFSVTPQEKRAEPWVLGLAFMELQPETFVVLRLQVDEVKYDHTRPLFEAMVESLRIEDPGQVAARRKTMLERGELWLELLEEPRRRSALVAEQWLRLRQRNVDIGYMQIRQRQTTEMDMPGMGVVTLATVMRGDRVYDSESRFFASDDGHHEIWSIKMALRPLGPGAPTQAPPKGAHVATWMETGYRSHAVIEVKRESPEGITTRQWPRPPKAYLSQMDWHLAGAMMPHNARQDMAFYAYHPNTGRIMLRTVTVLPAGDGSYRVVTKPGPDHPQDTTYYDAQGRFLRRQLHGGTVVRPTTPEELRVVWNLH